MALYPFVFCIPSVDYRLVSRTIELFLVVCPFTGKPIHFYRYVRGLSCSGSDGVPK
jgi:hypothetical protein